MKNYLISSISITLIITIINLILPKGKLSKYVKSICSFILAFSLVFPLLNFNGTNLNDVCTNSNKQIILQEDYISYVFNQKKQSDNQKVQLILSDYGINYEDIKIEYNVANINDFIPKKIRLTLGENNANINENVICEIKNVLSNCLSVDTENIFFYV